MFQGLIAPGDRSCRAVNDSQLILYSESFGSHDTAENGPLKVGPSCAVALEWPFAEVLEAEQRIYRSEGSALTYRAACPARE